LVENLGTDCEPLNLYQTNLYLVGWGGINNSLALLKGVGATILGFSENSQKIMKEEGFETDKTLFKIELYIISPSTLA